MSLAVLGGERIAEHGHFLNGINRRRQRQIVEPQRPDVDAVHGVIRRAVTATLDRHVLVPAAARRAELRPAIEGLAVSRPPTARRATESVRPLIGTSSICCGRWSG